MEKFFTVRVQKIGVESAGKVNSMSVPLVIEPEESVSPKRGCIYATVEVGCSAEFDGNLILKIITDTLHSEYFHNPEGTPLSCIEKAIVSVKDKVFNLLNTPQTMTSFVVEFNAVIGVLWGNILYVVQYGNGCSYLVRYGKINPINTVSEGSFSVASGTVHDGDFVVLGSKTFCERYDPSKILSLSAKDINDPTISSVILKFSESNKINLPVSEAKGVIDSGIKVKRGKNNLIKKFAPVLIGLIVFGALVYSISSSLKNKSNTKVSVENKQMLEETAKKLDEVNKVTRVVDDIYFDLKIDDLKSDVDFMSASLSNLIIFSDAQRNTLQKFLIDGKKLSPIETTVSGKQKYLTSTNFGISFLGEKAYFDLDGGNNKLTENKINLLVKVSDITSASFYLGNVYYTSGIKIYKNESEWVTNEKLSSAVSLVIDGSIYVLTKNGEVLKFTSGKNEDFEVKGLDKPMTNPTQLLTGVDFKNLYILDKGNKRVLVLDKNGVLVKQFIPKLGIEMWGDLKGISVSPDEKQLFVLSGTKLYKLML